MTSETVIKIVDIDIYLLITSEAVIKVIEFVKINVKVVEVM